MKLPHAVALVAVLITRPAFALTGKRYLPESKITPQQARQIALKTYPGTIVSEELEAESGGSGLRYSFVIRNNNLKHEVGIDAKAGNVLEDSIER
jgi:uncharacterized membrane protein YkoI